MKKGYILLFSTFFLLFFSFFAFAILLNLNIEILKVSNEINNFIAENDINDALKEVIFRLINPESPFYIGETGILTTDWSVVITDRDKTGSIDEKIYSSIKFLFGDTLKNIKEIRLSYKKKDGLLYFYDDKNNLQFAGDPREFSNRFKPVIIVEMDERRKNRIVKIQFELAEINYQSEISNPFYFNVAYLDSTNPIIVCENEHKGDIPFNTGIDFCKGFHKERIKSYQENKSINLELKDVKWDDKISERFGFYRLNEIRHDLKGNGLIYVDGDLRLSGNTNISWKGLLYIDGSLIISPDFMGSIWICGSLVVKNDFLYMGKRNDIITILYSSENLEFLKKRRFIILNEKRR